MFNSEDIGAAVRHLVTAFGGAVVANGMITQDQLTQLAGGAAIAAGLAWSLILKYKARKNAQNSN